MRVANLSLLLGLAAGTAGGEVGVFHAGGPWPSQLERLGPLVAVDDDAGWELSSGRNIEATAAAGIRPAGLDQPTIRLQVRRRQPGGAPEENWCRLDLPVRASAEWAAASGIRVVLGTLEPTTSWWIQLGLVTPAGTFSQVLEPYGPHSSTMTDRLLPLARFKGPAGATLDLATVTRAFLVLSAATNTLHLAAIEVYRERPEPTGWLVMTTNEPRTSVFERGAPVTLRFALGGSLPPGVTGLRYQITDYFQAPRHSAAVPWDADQTDLEVTVPPDLGPGFYEVRAWWQTAAGDLEPDSCLRLGGSLPPGLGTFAVMPRTIAENRAGMVAESFFGLHNGYANLDELIGATWRLTGGKWPYIEPQRPERDEAGMAPWARTALAGPAAAPWAHAVYNYTQTDTPRWARREGDAAPPWRDWAAWEALLRDQVRVQRHQFGHLSPRLYDLTWEIDLRMAPIFLGETKWQVDDVIEVYRRGRAIIRELDPTAIILGPNPSTVNRLEWLETMFQAGLLDHIDAISIHPYHGEPPPENYQLPERIAAIRALIRRYAGRDLPIYGLEQGYKAIRGSVHHYRETGRDLLRANLIFQGEGLRMNLPFYGYDYASEPWGYGICFNLDPKLNWGPKQVMPKAHVPALATQVAQLNLARPVRHLRWLGEDVWGYLFEQAGQPVLVLWTKESPRSLALPVGAVASIERVDLMGGETTLPVSAGLVELELGPDPVYLRGADAGLWLAEPREPRPLHAGEQVDWPLAVPQAVLGPVTVEPTAAGLRVAAAANQPPGIAALRLADGVEWIQIVGPIELREVRAESSGLHLRLRNAADRPWSVTCALVVPAEAAGSATVTIPAKGEASVELPLPARLIDPSRALPVIVQISPEGASPFTHRRQVSFLTAVPREAPPAAAPAATIRGRGSSDQEDQASFWFAWDDARFYLTCEVRDDVHHQTRTDDNLWAEDSLQLGFEAEPDREVAYNPLVGFIDRRYSDLSFALTPTGPRAVRHLSPDPDRLPPGDITDRLGDGLTITRAAGLTRYELALPWAELGVAAAAPGQRFGLAALVNDHDGPGTQRTGLEFHGGIMSGKDPSRYGSLTLR